MQKNWPAKLQPRHIGYALLALAIIALAALAATYENALFRWLQDSTNSLQQLATEHPLLFRLTYILLYAALLVLLLPVDSTMMLVGGIALGFWEGALLSCTIHTASSAITFAMSRILLRRRRLKRQDIEAMKQAKEDLPDLPKRNGNPWLYLFLLRLLPFLPTSAISIVIASTRLPLFGFLSATWLGTLPYALFFAYIGTKIRLVDEAADLLTVDMLLALLLFGALIAVGQFVWRRKRQRKTGTA